jgi:hypothetical protein
MKFWKLLCWGGFIVFLVILVASWAMRETKPYATAPVGEELPVVPTIR